MYIKGKHINTNLWTQNYEVSALGQDSIPNESIFGLDNANKNQDKLNQEKAKYLNNKIQQVKNFTIEKIKEDFENNLLEYNYTISQPEFYKALDMYLDVNLNSMVEVFRKNAAELGEEEYDAAIKGLGKFVDKVNSLDL